MQTLQLIKKLFLIVFAICLVEEGFGSELVKDPLAYELENETYYKGERIWWFEADLDGDGRNDMFIANNRFTFGGSADPFWSIYKHTESGYRALKGASFPYSLVYVGYFEPIKGRALVTYWKASGSEGTIVAFKIKDDEIAEKESWTQIVKRFDKNEEDEKLFEDIFGKIEKPRQLVKSASVEELQKKYKIIIKERPSTYPSSESPSQNVPIPNKTVLKNKVTQSIPSPNGTASQPPSTQEANNANIQALDSSQTSSNLWWAVLIGIIILCLAAILFLKKKKQ